MCRHTSTPLPLILEGYFIVLLSQKDQNVGSCDSPHAPLKNGLAGAFLCPGVPYKKIVVFVNKNLFHLYFYSTKPT